jgi:YebC/PmpR family DNA-binding regulatory protein
MSGHSKWSTIKHKKAATDAKRGKVFTKLIKEITVSARDGGGDQTANPRLRTAIANAKSVNMPNDNIERAIKKGTGELPGVTYDEISYEGYGMGGVAVMVDVLTDNKNRTVAEIRSIFSKSGGSVGENGCVSWMFDKVGLVTLLADAIGEDDLMEIVLDAGAEDLTMSDDIYEVKTPIDKLEPVRDAITEKNLKIETAEITMIPQTTVKLDEADAKKMLRLMDALDDQDDVQNVYANFDISDDILEKLGA